MAKKKKKSPKSYSEILSQFPPNLLAQARSLGVSDEDLPAVLYHIDKLADIVVGSYTKSFKKKT